MAGIDLTKSRFGKYLAVGVLSAGIEFFLLVLLVERFKVELFVANTFAFIFTSAINYLLSRIWVFERTGVRKRKEFPVFMFFVTCGLLINQAGLYFLTEFFNIDYRIAKIMSISLVVVWNFMTRKRIVFKKSVSSNLDNNGK
jgi:putative flippase GtrA